MNVSSAFAIITCFGCHPQRPLLFHIFPGWPPEQDFFDFRFLFLLTLKKHLLACHVTNGICSSGANDVTEFGENLFLAVLQKNP